MGDFEALLADVSYLMAMEKSRNQPTETFSKKIVLPDKSVKNVMQKYLEKTGELAFEKIFNQKLGFLLFKDFCKSLTTNAANKAKCGQIEFYESIKQYEKMETAEERLAKAQEIYDTHVMAPLLQHNHPYSKPTLQHVQRQLIKNHVPVDLFQPYATEIFDQLKKDVFQKFLDSDSFVRFCQWKNFELNLRLTMDDFTVHRTLGRGGFGLVSGCRKADTGKMYAMKCLEKKRIKVNNFFKRHFLRKPTEFEKARHAETLAINERVMLSLASTGDYCPFIVCMTYAYQTPEQLYLILDLMNGGDLHYHLIQHGVFNEKDMKFYAVEITLGLEHMHNRCIVYRDLKPANILLEETGHIRISDLGLACEYSHKKPHASVGTRGFMAPEVLAHGQSYDSSADWFSLGCTLYLLMKNHTPFKQPKKNKEKVKNKDKDKQKVEEQPAVMKEPDLSVLNEYTPECKDFLAQLMKLEVNERLGCKGGGPNEVKGHPFFKDIEWQQAFLRRLTPPLIPPRGEVNAMDQYEIGQFDDDKGIKMVDTDQEVYKDFDIVISERWQQEIADTVFERVNAEADRREQEARQDGRKNSAYHGNEQHSDIIVHGYVKKLSGPFGSAWITQYGKLYPSRLELHSDAWNSKPDLIFMDQVQEIDKDLQQVKGQECIVIRLKTAEQDAKLVLSNKDKIALNEWHLSLMTAHKVSCELMQRLNPKAMKIYGINYDPLLYNNLEDNVKEL